MPKPTPCAENTALIMLPLCLEGISNVVARPGAKKNVQGRVARLELDCSTVQAQWGRGIISTQVCVCVQWRRCKG